MKRLKVIGLLLVIVLFIGGCKKDDSTGTGMNEGDPIGFNEPDVNVESAEPTATTQITATATAATTATATASSTSKASLIEAKNASNYTVVIDAGHQGQGNNEHEPIGPGATETKPKVSSGTTGVVTKVPEYKVTLQVSKKIETLLKSKGYNVIMCRDTHDINISNAERAQVANNANADVFIRIHCNGAENSSAKGALTMCQTKNNKYCGQYYSKSRSLSEKVLKRICEATGANNKGILESDTMSGINWCSVPVTIIEMGFMSNPEEDKLLVDDSYQDKMSVGICNGVIEYLNAQ